MKADLSRREFIKTSLTTAGTVVASSVMIAILLAVWGTVNLSFSSVNIDGIIKNGYRVLTLETQQEVQDFHVYRGDYIKFELPGVFKEAEIVIPTLEERKKLRKDLKTTSYIKMKKVGDFPYTIDTIKGTITVFEYDQPSYKALTAKEAKKFIKDRNPLILDVRTPQEYKSGHIKNSKLIPIQVLQSQLKQLDIYKNGPVLIYCATGNRSTVASKILIDSGFKEIMNLKRGIVGWHKKKLPIIR